MGLAPKYGAAGPLEADVLPSHTGATVLSGPQRHFLAYSLYAGSNAQLFNVPWQSMVGLIPCADSMPGDKAPPIMIIRKEIIMEMHLLMEKIPPLDD
ncbi:MAG TPA: hypothetical protein ENG93_02405 [Nitrospirae bacterium]|nr:hypothetical protein [Nitrospirota bacterium]